MSMPQNDRKEKKGKQKLLLFAGLFFLLLFLNQRFSWTQWLSDAANPGKIKDAVEERLLLAFFLYSVLTATACVLLALPGVSFALLAGMLFGPWLGIFACLFACTLGASLAFLAGRYFLKDAVKPMLEKNQLLKKMLFSGNRKNEVLLLMITRLVPVFPYNLQNFAYGITDIGFWRYTGLSFVFMLPGVSFFTIGAAGLTAGEDAWKYYLTAGVLAVLVTGLGVLIKKNCMGDESAEAEEKEETEADGDASGRCAYVIMTRVPVPGRTKTRLMTVLSGEQCAELHTMLLKDLREQTAELFADIFISYADDCEHAKERIEALFPDAAGYLPQSGAELFARMKNVFEFLSEKGYGKIVLTGSDIPELGCKEIEAAFAALSTADAVLSPTEDGGYYLIGMKRPLGLFSIEGCGGDSVYEKTCNLARSLGISVAGGRLRSDLDTKEDLKNYFQRIRAFPGTYRHTEQYLLKLFSERCTGCGACRRACCFLEKYGLTLPALFSHPELSYSCFLCGSCRECCPEDISGKEIALSLRRMLAFDEPKAYPGKDAKPLLWEKNPYRFAAYRTSSPSAVWFGCNFPAFYPKSTERLCGLAKKHGAGVIFDCCQKPVYELGKTADAEQTLASVIRKLEADGVRELIMVCPNCYYFMRDRLPETIRAVSIYRKLPELFPEALSDRKCSMEEGTVQGAGILHLPCPDRTERLFLKELCGLFDPKPAGFFPEEPKRQCCGLGGCAFLREPQLSRQMACSGQTAYPEDGTVYTYCASCVSGFMRNGVRAEHFLPLLLGIRETPSDGIRPFLNRAGKLFFK